MNKNYFRTRIFPPLFISFNLKFKSIDDGKLSKNIFESKLIKVSYRLPMNKNRFRTKVFPPLFVSFNLKFKSMDDGTLDGEKLSKNIFESKMIKVSYHITASEQEEEYFLL